MQWGEAQQTHSVNIGTNLHGTKRLHCCVQVYCAFWGSSCKAPPYVNLSNVILERMLIFVTAQVTAGCVEDFMFDRIN